ncbi:MAG: serine/threonine-protein kinase [Planctomycetota bacterium]
MHDSDATNPVEALFLRALELPSGERDVFLEKECAGNPELLKKVQELLAAHEQTGSFLVDGQAEWTGEAGNDAPHVGSQIGPYKLREKIGEGGMGEVYVAEQEKPIARKVALKVIKRGMDSKAVLARFEAEQQALALMNHRNIAKVLDAGMSPSGSPYFVMELVSGMPITEYCDEKRLNIEERLELFIQVCRAIQHAHQKGIIHRDIKPSNVLVTEEDGQAVPKVIDFGVAKALSQKLTDRTVYTSFQAFVGTPLYASPEQASLSNNDVDTRSDVYSLGVLLYELVTGSTPYRKEDLQKAAYEEMCRIIREQEADRPSTRLTTLGNTVSSISERRRSDPTRLIQSVRGDLDWIVMKSLEKDRGRRYEGASSLAMDIHRMLKSEPISARPPTLPYRTRRFAQRNRRAVAMIVLATSLFSFVAISLTQQMRSRALTAGFQQSLSREIESLIVNGAFSEASTLLKTAEAQGIASETIGVLSAQIELFSSDTYQTAIDRLKEMRAEASSPDLTIDSMLCLAYQRNGQEEEHLDLLEDILERDCHSFSDHLYRGYAANIFFPERALIDLREARKLEPTSHLAMLVASETEQNVGELTLDPTLGLEAIENGIEGLLAVQKYLPDNDIVQVDLALAQLNASFRNTEIGRKSVARELESKADSLFLQLPPDFQNALRARSSYFLYKADFPSLQADFELGNKTCGVHAHQALAVAIGNYRSGDPEVAVEILGTTGDTFTAAFEIFLSLDDSDPVTLRQELQRIETGRHSAASVYGVFDATIWCLLGEDERSWESLNRFRRLAERTNKAVWSEWSKFLSGRHNDPNRLLDASDTTFDLAYSHFFIAFKALSENDRALAKKHFRATVSTNRFELFAYYFSEAFLERIDDPDWLPWIDPIETKAAEND